MDSGTAGASAAPALIESHAATSCGADTTVKTPTAAGQANPKKLAAALGVSPSTSLLADALNRHVRWLDSVACIAHPDHNKHHKLPRSGQKSASWDSQNWSGYEASSTAPSYIQSYWTVPAVSEDFPTGGPYADYSSIWPGIGGYYNDGELIQDGTEQDRYCKSTIAPDVCTNPASSYYFWFEIVPGEYQQEITNLVPNPGDSVATSASWDSTNGASFMICDLTQNACVNTSQPSGAPGNSAEWIVERTMVGTSLPPLANFGTVTMTNNTYNDSVHYEQLPDSGTPGDMYNGNDRLTSTSGLDSNGDTFSVTWLSSQ